MKKIILFLGVAGMLFAGYLSAVKFFSKTCAFHESCPYFLGYPACYYGFAMFTAITLCAFLWVRGILEEVKARMAILLVSFLGILFAGYFTVQELPLLFREGFAAYFFGLPTCALGLIFYLAIFFIILVSFLRKKT